MWEERKKRCLKGLKGILSSCHSRFTHNQIIILVQLGRLEVCPSGDVLMINSLVPLHLFAYTAFSGGKIPFAFSGLMWWLLLAFQKPRGASIDISRPCIFNRVHTVLDWSDLFWLCLSLPLFTAQSSLPLASLKAEEHLRIVKCQLIDLKYRPFAMWLVLGEFLALCIEKMREVHATK